MFAEKRVGNQHGFLFQVKTYVELSRPANVLIGMISIAVGALAAGSFSPWNHILLASLSGAMITAAANAINDYFDIAIDRINKPHRPLPSGRLSANAAKYFAVTLFFLGIFLALFIRFQAVFIACTAAVLLYLYSFRCKRMVLVGNGIVSFISGLAFIYGGVAVNRIAMATIPAGFAFFYHFGREVLKDIEDLEGDQLENARTFPVRFGLNPSRWLITAIFLLLIFLTLLPYSYHIFGKLYLIVVGLGVDLFLVFVIYSLWKDPSRTNLHRLSEWLRWDMVIGILAIIAGVQFK